MFSLNKVVCHCFTGFNLGWKGVENHLTDDIAGEIKSDGLVVGIVVEEFEFGFKIRVDALVRPILHSWCSETTRVSALFGFFLDQLLN